MGSAPAPWTAYSSSWAASSARLMRRSDDIEVFVEQIPFDETRLYVKRIVISWGEYRRIYAGP